MDYGELMAHTKAMAPQLRKQAQPIQVATFEIQ
jgi:hypothetical protein